MAQVHTMGIVHRVVKVIGESTVLEHVVRVVH